MHGETLKNWLKPMFKFALTNFSCKWPK